MRTIRDPTEAAIQAAIKVCPLGGNGMPKLDTYDIERMVRSAIRDYLIVLKEEIFE